jgi:hypothetical protein
MVEFRNRMATLAPSSGAGRPLKSLGFGALGVALALATTACGEEDEPTCGTVDEPRVLELVDLTPADGSSVVNSGIVQGFTIVGFDALIQDFSFAKSTLHTAGDPTPATFSITATAVAQDEVRYEFAPFQWSVAPAHVELVAAALYRKDECVYSLLPPVFRYDVTAP